MTKAPSRPLVVRTFMTHEMHDEDIAALATGHNEEFDRIMSAIERSRRSSPGSLQHIVLYGSRGFGKSFMTRRVEIAVSKLACNATPIIYLLLPEEQHNLQRSPHAFLDTVTHKIKHATSDNDEAYYDTLFRWPKTRGEAKSWADSAIRLESAVDAAFPNGHGLVVVVAENFDTLLATLFKNDEDEQRLRMWLDRRNNRVMLFATATGTVDMDYDRPLFKAFEPIRLSPWTTSECIAYFNRQRERDGRKPLDSSQQAKALAISEFIGGTPRLAQLLAGVLDTQDALSVAETMSALADRLAEYYRRRVEDLPPLGRGLLDALIRGGEPASQTELAARVEANGQASIARAMLDLQQADIIRGRPALIGKETLYAVTDRVFVHYYRIRQGSRVVRATPLVTILDFLRSFYTRDEQRAQSLKHLEAGQYAEAGLFSRLALEGKQPNADEYTDDFIYRLSFYSWIVPGSLDQSLEKIASALAKEPANVYSRYSEVSEQANLTLCSALRAQALYRLGHVEQAEAELLEAHSKDPAGRLIAGIELMRCLMQGNKNARLSELCVELQALLPKIEPSKVRLFAMVEIGACLLSLNQLDVQESLARRAVRLGREIEHPELLRMSLNMLFTALASQSKYEQALDVENNLEKEVGKLTGYSKVLTHSRKAFALTHLGRHEESLVEGREAIRLASRLGEELVVGEVMVLTASSLFELKRYDEAWIAAAGPRGFQEPVSTYALSWGSRYALKIAMHERHDDIVRVFKQWIEQWQLTTKRGGYPSPALWLEELFVAAARANKLDELDLLIREEGTWLASESLTNLKFDHSHGQAIAKIIEREGSNSAYETLAALLPRIAAFIDTTPANTRVSSWLPDLLAGFATNCNDPDLLRALAKLLARASYAKGQNISNVLVTLARVDESDSPEMVLSRTDPDISTLVRRLRHLPDPIPARPKRVSGRRRKRTS